jgi:SCY1-like protein 2
MGTTLTKNYDVEAEPCGAGGLSGLWRIYSCKRKTKDRAALSIFMFDKKRLDRKRTNRDDIINSLKAEVLALVRLRHPCILQVVEPLLEDSKTLAFVTEPVIGSLTDLLKQPAKLQSLFTDLEIRLGLMDIIEALNFLHSEARLLHLAVCPDNIYLTPQGKWRLAGLSFAQTLSAERKAVVPATLDFLSIARRQRFSETEIPEALVPPLNYTAPELIGLKTASPASDLFSVAGVTLSTYKALVSSARDYFPFEISDVSEQGHKDAISSLLRLASSSLTCVPDGLKETVQRFLAVSPDRGQIHEFLNSRGFQDTPIKALNFLEHIHEKQDAQKLQFLKGLHKLIEKFEESLVMRRVLPLLSQLIQTSNLSAQALPSLVEVMKRSTMSKAQFTEQIWPCLERLTSGKEISAQTLFILLSEVEVFIQFTTAEQCRSMIMPLVFKSMECGVPQLQEIVMKKIPCLVAKVDDKSYLKVQILPRFLQGLLTTRSPSVREEGLRALTQLFVHFDRPTLVETILPSLDKMRKQDVTSSTSMLLLEAYSSISTLLGPRVAALNIMPALCPLLVDADVSKEQFEVIVTTLTEMLQSVRTTRMSELTSLKYDDAQVIVPTEHSGDDDLKADSFFQEFFASPAPDVSPKPVVTPDSNLFSTLKITDPGKGQAREGNKAEIDDIFANFVKPADKPPLTIKQPINVPRPPPPPVSRTLQPTDFPRPQASLSLAPARPQPTLSSFQSNPFSTQVPAVTEQPKVVGRNPFAYNSDDFFNELLTREKDPFEGL